MHPRKSAKMWKQGNKLGGTPNVTAVSSPSIKSEDPHPETLGNKMSDSPNVIAVSSPTIKSEDPHPKILVKKEGENKFEQSRGHASS